MSNEIWHNLDEGNTLYAIIRKKDDDEVFDENDGGDTWEPWQDANVGNYDVPMTDHDGDYYSVDFPAVIATSGVYRVTVFLRAGVAPHADNDTSLAQGEIYWDGSEEIDLLSIDIDARILQNVYNETSPRIETDLVAEG